MTNIFRSSFYGRKKQANPLEEEEESLAVAAVAGEYRDLEDDSAGKEEGHEKPGSGGGGARGDDDTVCFIAYLASCVGICYVLLGSFYFPQEAGVDGGGVIVVLGGLFLAVGGPVLVRSLASGSCSRRRRR